MTAEEWFYNDPEGKNMTYWISVEFANNEDVWKIERIHQIMEQYAKKKVLEALEKEVSKAFREGQLNEYRMWRKEPNGKDFTITKEEYYNKEVKPKYQ